MKTSRLLLAAAALLALAACQDKAPAPAATDAGASSPAETAGPEAKPGLSLADGKLVLPAVKGNPAAAYFSLTNGSGKAVTLAGVAIDGAGKAEMHETAGGSMAPLAKLELQPGQTVKFERGGKHVMVFDPGSKLSAGSTTEVTLTFADGDKLSAPLGVQAVGAAATDGMAGMEGMEHGDMH